MPTNNVNVPLSDKERKKLEAEAAKDSRSLAGQMRHYMTRCLVEDGRKLSLAAVRAAKSKNE